MSGPAELLRIDWATTEATRFACERWHYTGSVPMPPIVQIGVWEAGKFIGVVLFSRGASPHLGTAYGLKQNECCELTRVALTKHVTPVSRIIAIAIKFLRKSNPGLRLIVSFADANQGHHGGIYQAGGWLYAGTTAKSNAYLTFGGRRLHQRQVSTSGVVTQFGKTTRAARAEQCTIVEQEGKHRYLMPLDALMRASVAPLACPYPKREHKHAAAAH